MKREHAVGPMFRSDRRNPEADHTLFLSAGSLKNDNTEFRNGTIFSNVWGLSFDLLFIVKLVISGGVNLCRGILMRQFETRKVTSWTVDTCVRIMLLLTVFVLPFVIIFKDVTFTTFHSLNIKETKFQKHFFFFSKWVGVEIVVALPLPLVLKWPLNISWFDSLEVELVVSKLLKKLASG